MKMKKKEKKRVCWCACEFENGSFVEGNIYREGGREKGRRVRGLEGRVM